MFELFLKYPISTWRHADFIWSSGWPLAGLLLCLFLAVVVIGATMFRQQLSAPKRVVLGALQFCAVATALIMLWQPTLRIELMQSGENTVAYLLDTSKSMLINEGGSLSRLDKAAELLSDDTLINNNLFDASIYSMAEGLSSVDLPLDDQVTAIANSGDRSAIAASLQTVLESVNDQALAAVVVLSDGADNASDLSSDWWQAIKAAGVPVHTVGFGKAVVANDVELSDVFMDGQAGENSVVTVRLRIVHNGHPVARVRVEAGDELLHAQNIELDATQGESIHTIEFNSGDAGVRDLKFSLAVDGTEANAINNVQQRVLNVADNPKRVLYVEGEPRWEYKFIRRALHSFSGVEVVSLLRTSPNKFYRQGVRSAEELVDGFPKTREALFGYSAVIIGSLEAAELSTEQQANLRDFVSERGGSLLMLAGQKGLGDGGWGRSAVAASLPVKLTSKTNANDYERIRVSVQPTTQGLRTPWLQLENDGKENLKAWSQLPELNDVQPLGEVKPGSTVLLATNSGASAGGTPLLVWHRYGQGQSYVLGTSGTWRWQMSLPAENQWHEMFWQQFLGHLTAGSLPQLSVDDAKNVYRDADEIPIAVTARAADYQPLESGELIVNVTTPSGAQVPARLTADINQPGRYIGSIEAVEDGPYAITMNTPMAGEAQAAENQIEIQRWLIKESGTAEQFDTGLHREFLQRVSAATGGRYLDVANKDELAEILSTQNAGITREELLPLWNMPLLFLLILLAKALEWLLRLGWKRL